MQPKTSESKDSQIQVFQNQSPMLFGLIKPDPVELYKCEMHPKELPALITLLTISNEHIKACINTDTDYPTIMGSMLFCAEKLARAVQESSFGAHVQTPKKSPQNLTEIALSTFISQESEEFEKGLNTLGQVSQLHYINMRKAEKTGLSISSFEAPESKLAEQLKKEDLTKNLQEA